MDLRFLSRKRYVVKPAYQLKLALTFFIYISIYSIILGFIIFYPLYIELNASINLEEQTRIASLVLYLHKRIWLGLFTVAVLAGIHTIFSSHKVVGPMVRFEKAVEDLINGDYANRIRIRRGDEFKDMETLLNRLAGVLELSRTRDAQFHADVKTRLETVSALLEAEGAAYPGDVRTIMQRLIDEVNARQGAGPF